MELKNAPIQYLPGNGAWALRSADWGGASRPMCIVSSKIRGRKQLTSWVSCKAWAQDTYAYHFAKVTHPGKENWTGPGNEMDVDEDRIRLAVGLQGNKWQGALHLVNAYERDCQCGLTRAYNGRADLTLPPEEQARREGKTGKVVLFVGPKMWLATPHIFAMYTLLLRVGSNCFSEEGPNLEGLTPEELIPIYEKWVEMGTGNNFHGSDRSYLRDSYDIMHIVPRHHKEAYAVKLEKGPASVWRGSQHSDGIQYMCCSIRHYLGKMGLNPTGYHKEAEIYASIIREVYPDLNVVDKALDNAMRW